MENMNIPSRQGAPQGVVQPQTAEVHKQAPAIFNVKDYLMLMWSNWYWLLIVPFIAFVIAFFYVRTRQPEYERVSDLEIKATTSDGELNMKEYLGLQSHSTNTKNEIYIMQSYKLARHVSNDMHMDIRYYVQGTFRKAYLFEDRPFEVVFSDKYSKDVVLSVCPVSARSYKLQNVWADGDELELDDPEQVYEFDSLMMLPEGLGQITLKVNDQNYPALMSMLEQSVYVLRMNPEDAAYRVQSMMSAEAVTQNMIRITCRAQSVDEADAVLAGFIKAYNEQSLTEKNAVLVNSQKFVEESIRETARELGDAATQLSKSGMIVSNIPTGDPKKQRATSSNNGVQAVAEATARAEARDQFDLAQRDLDVAQDMQARIRLHISQKDYIPVLPGLSEAGVSGQIAAYNEKLQQRNQLVKNSSIDNPAVRRRDADLETLEVALLSSVDAYVESVRATHRMASIRLSRLNQSGPKDASTNFDSVSVAAQSLAISKEYKQEYFSFLLKRREELRLELAVSDVDTRVIEDPMGDTSPVYPVAGKIFAKFIGVGFAIPALVLLILVLVRTQIRGRKDIEDAVTVPLLGEVPDYQDSAIRKSKWYERKKLIKQLKAQGNRIVINQTSSTLLAEAFHILQSNLSFIQCEDTGKRPQTIMFTSFAPGAGKSFVSVNLASSLANTEKRSIWVDMDIRKGHKNEKLFKQGSRPRHNEGLSKYLAGKCEIEDCIFESANNDHLDILPAGPVPPNCVQLLMSQRLDELIAYLRERYEYIILDSVPALAVADAAISNRVADFTIYVVRVGHTDRSILPEVEKIYQQRKFRNLSIVMNGAVLNPRIYGYGSVYGSGYGYGYGYGHNHEEKK